MTAPLAPAPGLLREPGPIGARLAAYVDWLIDRGLLDGPVDHPALCQWSVADPDRGWSIRKFIQTARRYRTI